MTVGGQPPVTYAYDANSRLRSIIQSPLNPVTIDYDASGRRTLLTLPNGVSTTYQYDPASRLTALIYRNTAAPLGDITYQYDPADNRTAVGGSFARTLLPQPVATASYDPANRQVSFGSKSLDFDPNGDLIAIGEGTTTTTLTWDGRGRLHSSLSTPELAASFAYDALGRRAQKTLNGQTTAYQYNGPNAIRVITGGAELRYLRTLAVDELLVQDDGSSQVQFLADGLGSPTALTDVQGAVIGSYSFEPFGGAEASGTTGGNPFQFTGRDRDETGLYYYRARYYHSALARFISEDPLRGVSEGLNAYAYVRNNPTNLTDPSGLLDTTAPGRRGPDPGGRPKVTPDRPPIDRTVRYPKIPPRIEGMPPTPQQGGTHMPGTPGTETPVAPSTSKAARAANLLLRALTVIVRALARVPFVVLPVPEEVLRCASRPGGDIHRCREESEGRMTLLPTGTFDFPVGFDDSRTPDEVDLGRRK
jgi:RHS repeat-associated protein